MDEDINIYDPFEIDWAWNFRVQPQRDMIFLPDAADLPWDPSQVIKRENGMMERVLATKVVIDATMKYAYQPIALPKPDHIEKVKKKWKEYGIGD